MPATPKPWQELLSQRFSNVHEEYGPNSQMVASAFVTLEKTKWLEHAGEPLPQDHHLLNGPDIVRVASWQDALTIIGEDRRYNLNGVLLAPCEVIEEVYWKMPERKEWWQKAREEAKDYTHLRGWVPNTLEREQRDSIYEYLYEFVSMLFTEIIVPEAGCTYFRDQLSWFQAGWFPCGWDGDWPSGRMRVF